MIAVSSQDFRNVYEKFYNSMRRYLWPFSVLRELAEVETNIYSAFIDMPKLKVDFDKLYSSMKDTLKEDAELRKYVSKLSSLLDNQDATNYFKLFRVNEVNPEKPKQLKSISNEEDRS